MMLSKLMKGLAMVTFATAACGWSPAHAVNLPAPAIDETRTASSSSENLTVAGGCFWGVQAVFQHVKGVTKVVSGYAGGSAADARYNTVSTGKTGHAEAVQITYDPSQITAGKLLQVFFAVAHDPTELNKQGPDHGTQYRSAIFYASPEQQKIASAYIAQIDAAKAFTDPVATKLEALAAFYPAEDYHQDYLTLHPDQPYIVINDMPKLKALEKAFPDLYKS